MDKFVYHPLYIIAMVTTYLICIPLQLAMGNVLLSIFLVSMQIPWFIRGISERIFATYTRDKLYRIFE